LTTAAAADRLLWTGCLSGVFQEEGFLKAFLDAGFLAVRYAEWGKEPWQVVEGIEFRSVVLTAVKGAGTPCLDVGLPRALRLGERRRGTRVRARCANGASGS